MVGSSKERTGYSHEPLGIVVDAPAGIDNMLAIDVFIKKLDTKQLEIAHIKPFFTALQVLANDTLSYDEKNQAGGRALRTPYGHGKFVQYQTSINKLITISQKAGNKAIFALKLESQFDDIFTSDEKSAQEERASITFNREAFSLLDREYNDINKFYIDVCRRFKKQLLSNETQEQYNHYINERLPLIWAMKYEPAVALEYFADQTKQNDAVFTRITAVIVPPSAEELALGEPSDASELDSSDDEAIAKTDRDKINEILNTLKVNIGQLQSGRATWFTTNSESKVARLQAIQDYLVTHEQASKGTLQNLLALIRGVCTQKRNPIGFFPPQSVREFDKMLIEKGLSCSAISFDDSDLNKLEGKNSKDQVESLMAGLLQSLGIK